MGEPARPVVANTQFIQSWTELSFQPILAQANQPIRGSVHISTSTVQHSTQSSTVVLWTTGTVFQLHSWQEGKLRALLDWLG